MFPILLPELLFCFCRCLKSCKTILHQHLELVPDNGVLENKTRTNFLQEKSPTMKTKSDFMSKSLRSTEVQVKNFEFEVTSTTHPGIVFM